MQTWAKLTAHGMKSLWFRLFLIVASLSFLQSGASADQPPPPDCSIEVELEYAPSTIIDDAKLLDPAAIKRFQRWRFKPKKVRPLVIPIPPILVPPPRNYESSRSVKAIA